MITVLLHVGSKYTWSELDLRRLDNVDFILAADGEPSFLSSPLQIMCFFVCVCVGGGGGGNESVV